MEVNSRYIQARQHALPDHIDIPEGLPIAAHADVIAGLLKQHPVLVVAGETGSGKTTQLPKICLRAGFGRHRMVGHTQPRRLAATSVAARIAAELGVPLGQGVGFQVRFTDRTVDATFLKVMTDGILLNEIQQDPLLRRYEVLIIDEAHERSLNIDFILGYLKQLLPRRPDLRLIITSATIDLEKIAGHFSGAPIVRVSGRTFPVEIRYQPLTPDRDAVDGEEPQLSAIVAAVSGIIRSVRSTAAPDGDILIFFSSEKEIRETALRLRRESYPNTEILPLYARLKAAEQERVFQPHVGRRIILSTNIAETSLTVPGIRYVIDTGKVRISRYSIQSKIQRLPIEPVSRASADQRAGRCGRVADGICIRLFDEADYLSRPAFTEPEILRTNLASVILQMLNLGLGKIEDFPFIDPPSARAINDGFKLLYELNAIDEHRQLTPLGRQMAKLPVEPRFARIILAARQYGCLRESLIVVSGLSVADPREWPADQRQKSQSLHSEDADPQSDFLSLVRLWNRFEMQRQALANAALRRFCQRQFLSLSRMLEWRDVHRQLVTLCHGLGFRFNDHDADYSAVHRSLLAGLLNYIGKAGEGGWYEGVRNRRFRVLPGSTVNGKKARWIVASQILETEHAFAPLAAIVESDWVTEEAAHLAKRSWSEPHWCGKRQQVVAWEKIQLYGLVIQERIPVNFGPLDPATAREIFIREALVPFVLDTRQPFQAHNAALVERLRKDEEKLRRQQFYVDDRRLYEFYAERLPERVWDTKTFHQWYVGARKNQPSLLCMELKDLVDADESQSVAMAFPDQAEIHSNPLQIEYAYTPGQAADGATLTVPLELLGQLEPSDVDWAVPGQVRERAVFLMKALPKHLRKAFVPIPQFVDAALADLPAGESSLIDGLIREAQRLRNVSLDRQLFEGVSLPAYLQVKIRVVDDAGRTLAEPSELSVLQQQFPASKAAASLKHPMERDGVRNWDFGPLPEHVEVGDRVRLRRYPALVDAEDHVAIRLFADAAAAHQESLRGIARLYQMRTGQQRQLLIKQFSLQEKRWALRRPSCLRDLPSQAVPWIYRAVFTPAESLPRTQEAFESRFSSRGDLISVANRLERLLDQLVELLVQINQSLKKLSQPAFLPLKQNVDFQLAALLPDKLLETADDEWLWEYPRYLQAIEIRLDKAPLSLERDRQLASEVDVHWQRYVKLMASEPHPSADLRRMRWLIEELRVSLFAQQLKTKVSVSAQRLNRHWDLICR